MPRGKTGPHPISNRVSVKIGIHAKIDTDIHDILRILSMRYGGLPKAWLIEALITDWVKKTSERIGTNVIQQWADDMKEKRPLIPKEEFDLNRLATERESFQPVMRRRAQRALAR